MLRVHHHPAETLTAGPGRGVALVVPVVARAQVEEAAGPGGVNPRFCVLDRDGPAGVVTRPLGSQDAGVVTDVLVDAVRRCGLSEVAQDLVPVGDRLGTRPRAEVVAEGEHVRVRADSGVAELVPRPPARAACLEDRVRGAGGVRLQVAGGTDTGQTGADDEHVHVPGRRHVFGVVGGCGHGAPKGCWSDLGQTGRVRFDAVRVTSLEGECAVSGSCSSASSWLQSRRDRRGGRAA